MKKNLILVLALLLLITSCSTTKYSRSSSPEYAKFGREGEIILTGDARFFIPNVHCLNNVTVVFDGDDFCGTLKGMYTRVIFKQVVKHSDLKFRNFEDLSFCYTGIGKTFFSTTDAKTQYDERVVNGENLISEEDIRKINSAEEFAVYAKRPDISYKNIEKLILTKDKDSFDLNLYFDDEDSASSFYRILKSDFFQFESRDGISSALIMEQIDEHFFMSGNTVFIIDLAANRYLKNWVGRILAYGNNR